MWKSHVHILGKPFKRGQINFQSIIFRKILELAFPGAGLTTLVQGNARRNLNGFIFFRGGIVNLGFTILD